MGKLPLVLLIIYFGCSALAAAEKKPLWEIGLGAGGINQAYYTGTNQERAIGFPVIMPVYRGELFKSDDDGLRAEVIKDPRYKLDLSLDFNFSIDSDDIELRQGMEDIGSLLQIGPSLEVNLKKTDREQLTLNFPVRYVTEIQENSISSAGFTFSPAVSYYRFVSYKNIPWRMGMIGSIQFGSADYHDVYYGVDQQFATPQRPRYQPGDGYAGYRLTASAVSKNNSRLIVLFARYENIGDAVFSDSPLVETNNSFSVGLLYSRYLFKSKKLVD